MVAAVKRVQGASKLSGGVKIYEGHREENPQIESGLIHEIEHAKGRRMTLRRRSSSVFGGEFHRPDEPKRWKHRDQRTLHIKSGAGIVCREKDDEMVTREA